MNHPQLLIQFYDLFNRCFGIVLIASLNVSEVLLNRIQLGSIWR